jgi:cytochrome P450/glutathione S-transferase
MMMCSYKTKYIIYTSLNSLTYMTKPQGNLNNIPFNKDFSYAQQFYNFVTNRAGTIDEIARWMLDRNKVSYREDGLPPILYESKVNRLTGATGLNNHPVLVGTDALVYTGDGVIQYIDNKALPHRKLIPSHPDKRKEVMELYESYTRQLDTYVSQYFYGLLLQNKKFAKKLFKEGQSFFGKIGVSLRYGKIKKGLTKEYELGLDIPEGSLPEIHQIFEEVGNRFKDGRRYLTGDQLTLADLAFASVVAPICLPEEFGGSNLRIDEVPYEIRNEVIKLRATPAGQFALRVFIEDRPLARAADQIPKKEGLFNRFLDGIKRELTSHPAAIFAKLPSHPVLKIGLLKVAAVNRNDLLQELLNRDEDFTIEEINGLKMANQQGAFFLGMDRMNPQMDRERNYVRKATHKGDLERIRAFVRGHAEEVTGTALPFGKLDVAQSLTDPVLVRVLDDYFGVSAPTESDMKGWLRALFYDLFLNFTNNAKKHQLAVDAATARRAWIMELIEERTPRIKAGEELGDNILNRLIKLSLEPGYEWVDEDVIRRQIGGLLTGIQATTSKAVVLVLDELLGRKDVLPGAIAAAQARDMDAMLGYCQEALRFNPVQPGVLRYAEKQQTLKGNGSKEYTIPARTKVFALTSSVMFDPAAFPDPKQFKADRDGRYMNWGFGFHECYGKYINMVTIPEFTAAVLRLPNVRRASNAAGKGSGLHDGPFPNNFLVEFG